MPADGTTLPLVPTETRQSRFGQLNANLAEWSDNKKGHNKQYPRLKNIV